ncbi:phage tail-collar fiber domain-containing protein [Pseudomonas graminis]
MAASITLAGQSLIAQKQAAGQVLTVARFILANVPGLDVNAPVNRAGLKPPSGQIVYTSPVTQTGYVNPNQVVYSLMMGTDIGDFDFNWIGLETSDNVLLSVAYVPLQQKRKNILPEQIGNNVTRNFMLVFDGAQQLTAITIDASTWQFDYTARMKGIDERERLSNRDMFGRACFFGTALQMTKVGSVYQLKPGLAYIEGVRLERATATPVTVPAVPSKAWLDVVLQREQSDVVGTFQVVFGADKADYTDSVGARHYLVPLAELPTSSTVTDLRVVEAIDGELVKHFAARVGDYPDLRARATTKDDVGLSKIPNAISDAADSDSSAILATTKMVAGVRKLLQDAITALINGTSVAGKAARWATARKLSLTGGLTGEVSLDGSADASMSVTVKPEGHTHTIAQTTGLQGALDAKLPLAGGLVTGATAFFQGIHGGYANGNGGSLDWGACIWGIGAGYDGAGVNASYNPTEHYGLSWFRGSHKNAIDYIGEGVYLYQNGVLRGGMGSTGIYTQGIFYGNGGGVTHLNANHLNAGIIPDARLSGTYTGVNITGNAATASKWSAARTITFTGGATGTFSLDGSANLNVALAVQPSAHTHTVAQVTGLDAALIEAAPPGMVVAFATATAPTGWIKANGAAVSRTAFARLFNYIGTRFGAGDGSTTFNLPDVRGEFIRGLDDARGIDVGRVLGSWQASQNLAHNHTATAAVDGAHTHTYTLNRQGSSADHRVLDMPPGRTGSEGTAKVSVDSAGEHTHAITVGMNGGAEARPRNIAFLICIKY